MAERDAESARSEDPISLMLDLNVLLDVAQRREPFYEASAAALTIALGRSVRPFLAPHVFTTFYYVVRKSAGRKTAEDAVNRLLSHFAVAPLGNAELRRARSLDMADFEDAVVACAAEAAGCSWIVTRDVEDFGNSPVRALTPSELLAYAAEEYPFTQRLE